MPHRKLDQAIMARLGLKARRTGARDAPVVDPSESTPEERIERLEARVAHLEATIEGLQDSVYRETTRLDERVEQLQQKTEPHVLSQALSADARRRGI
jgi:uncharacterized coiled-coil protein SlyX